MDRLEVDLRWQAAAGTDVGAAGFHPTVLVGMRNRLRASARPRRLFEDTKVVAGQTGAMKGRVRVLDSTAVYDAVATQDTVSQLRASIRKVLAGLDQAGSPASAGVRRVLCRDDEYASPGKQPCDWDDPKARVALVDELVRDALAALGALDGQPLPPAAAAAAEVLALVAGQDVEEGDHGGFRIAWPSHSRANRARAHLSPNAKPGTKCAAARCPDPSPDRCLGDSDRGDAVRASQLS